TTIRKIVRLIKSAGAKEIHLRIGSPQVRYSCFYGIDTPSPKELVANCYSMDEIQARVEVDSLKHIAIEGLRSCVDNPDDYCFACFNGDYPLGVADAKDA
ncbi:MAG TPA: amidophosphoribosyltransferase, partial [Candidatus Cloacimonadota bacterium]|nr:amidophosphoribosyltransferase [Candidatus Cloacimonadota bacterium]